MIWVRWWLRYWAARRAVYRAGIAGDEWAMAWAKQSLDRVRLNRP